MIDNKKIKARGKRKHKSVGDFVFDFANYTLLAALTLV